MMKLSVTSYSGFRPGQLVAGMAILFLGIFSVGLKAQNVTVSGAVVGNGSYPDLGSAFTAINGGAQTGASINVSIVGNTTEPGTATLNQGAWNTLIISPSGGAARTITGVIIGVLVDLNGADNVVIDGLNTGGNSLTISNTSTGASNTIRFINDASVNVINRTTLLGSANSLSNGVVFFSTGTVTGNDNNIISNCNIAAAGANLPINGIFSLGTSAAIDNSSNTINANNISDFFNATSVSAGINLSATNSGNSNWTIANNRLFQTNTLLYTTANTHSAIVVGTGVGYTISNNIIGFANASGTGTYNMVGNTVALAGFPTSYTPSGTANATRFIAINCAFTAAGAVSSIQGNTIAGFALYTSSGATTTNGILCGINVTSGNADIGTTSGNTIGSTTGVGSIYTACTTTAGAVVGIFATSVNNVNIHNNTIGAIDAMGTTATLSGGITGINSAGTAGNFTILNNTIGNATNPNLRMGNLTTAGNLSNVGTTFGIASGTATFTGILNSATGTVTIGSEVAPNTIQNASLNSSATGSSFRGINISGGTYTITGNTVKNLTTACANTTVATGLLAGVGILGQGGLAGSVITLNTINNLELTNTTTTGTNIAGVSISNTAIDVTRNRIYDLRNASTSTTVATPGTASGVFIRSGTAAGNVNIVNNMISLGTGQTTNTSFIGIWANHGSSPNPNDIIYFNSIHIEGVAASGANPSFGFHRGNFATTPVNLVTVDIRNNIFNNTRSGGTGKHYAIGNYFNATANATGWATNASNFNILNSANPATIGFWTSDQNFAGWQAASASDANSISGATINFVNQSTADLHIVFPPSSVVEGVGTPIATVTLDYDGQTRSSFTPTDIGADAGNFLAFPAISLTPLANICTTGSRTLTASITDPDGVPTAGIGLPVLYWKINAGAYTAVTAAFSGGSTYTFTFGAGAVIGDVVSYYIVAQDNLGNVGSSPSFGASGFTINPPAAATPPTTPYSYTLNTSLSGTYTVGVAGTYTTLTAAVTAYNNSCLTGPVIFSLIDPTYASETLPIVINANADASATNTLTIKPAVTAAITGSSVTGMIQLNGADFIIIDGSIGNTPNSVCPAVSATRDLTITNTSATATSAVIWLGTTALGNAVTNATVQNCILIGNAPTTTIVGLGAGGPTIGTGGTNNNNINFINNDIRACQFAIYSSGASAANKNQNLVINQNVINAAAPNNVGLTGIYSAFTNNILVSGNTVSGMTNASSSDVVGINMGMGALSGIATTNTGIADGVSNVTITNNTVGSITQSGTFAAAGIALGNTISGTSLIANNMVYGVACNGTSTDFGGGLVLAGGTAQVNVFHNTVVMQGIVPGTTAASSVSTCLGVTSATPAMLNIKNNILTNIQAGNAGATFRIAAIGLGYAAPYTGLSSNYNDLFSGGTGPGTYTLGVTGGLVGTNRITLLDWQTETGQDLNSLNFSPVFVSPTDNHIVAANPTNAPLLCGGTIVPVTTDIDCQTRSLSTPSIGGDEIPNGIVPVITIAENSGTPNDGSICEGASVTLTASGGDTYVWSTGETTAVIVVSPTTATTYSVTVTVGTCSNATSVLISVSPSPTASISVAETSGLANNDGIICVGASAALTANGGGTYLWSTGATTAAITVAPAGSTTYTVTVTSVNGCTATASTTITVNPIPTAGIAIAETSGSTNNDGTICAGASATLTASGGGTYLWSTGATTPAITITPAGTTSYTVTVTSVDGCSATASVNIMVNPLPTAGITIDETSGITPNDGIICSGSSVTLTGTGGGTYQWSTGATTTSITVNPTIATFYTVTVTSNGCSSTASATITVNQGPLYTFSITNPSNCNTSDGAISVTMTAGQAPFTFAWTTPNGCGLSATAQNQSGLCAGAYFMTVTDINGCSNTGVFSLDGPAPGCFSCPTIGSLSVVPGTVCESELVTLTANGLSGMGITYGITFVYFTSVPADPYIGGTPIATIPNASLGGGGTTAQTTTSFATGNTYYIYAILSPIPTDPACRPSATGTLTVNPTPQVDAIASQTYCAGSTVPSVVFTSSVPGAVFSWSRTNEAIGLGANSGTGNVPSFTATNAGTAPLTSTFSVVASFTNNGITCTGTPIQFTITVNPNPQVNAVPNQTYCAGATVPSIVFSGNIPGATYSWSRTNEAIGLGTNSGTGNIPSFTATNAGTTPLTSTFSVVANFTNNGVTCTGTPIQFTITVNPNPSVNAVANQIYCAGSTVPSVTLTGNVPGAVYNWSRTNEAIGLGVTNGTGNIPTFTATNAGTAPITSTFTVTASYTNNGVTCSGAPITFTITINPTPQVNAVTSQTYCAGAVVPSIIFAGNVPGAVYTWSRTTEAIGLGVNSGTASVPSFTATNTGTAPLTSTFTVTPSYTNGGLTCTGTPITFTITVNPVPTINAVANQTYCAGSTVPSVVFTSNVPGVVFNWSRTAAAIGLAPTTGIGSVPSYTATNAGGTPISSTFTATASYTNNGVTCTSGPITFTITVNPTPVIAPVPNQVYCASGNIPPTFFTSNVPAAVYTWSRSGDDIGLGPVSGTGPIPSFTGVNNTTGPLTATFTVVATYSNNGVTCTSAPIQFTITICYTLHVTVQGDAYVCPGETETYFIDNYNPNSTYSWTLQNGGGFITADNGSSITVDWQDTPGGPFIIQVDESGCGDACHAYDFFPVYVQGVEAISCNDHVQISLNENCVAQVLSGMILEGETEGNDNYFVQLTDAFGNIIPDATLTVDQIGQTVTAMVLNECNGQSCVGTISVEDKIKPVIECTDVTISCGTSLEPVYEPPVTGFIQQAINSGLSIGPNAGTVTTQDLTLDLPTNAVLTDVNVLVDLNHTWVGDLSAELISPSGTTVLLINQLCGSVDNWANVIFDDQASVQVTASCNPQPPALTGSVIPQGSLSAVNGESASGTWTLRVTDNVGGDGGTLNTFGLNVSYFLAVTSAPYAFDACGEVELTYTDNTSGDDCDEQTLTRTWTATDGSGNTSTCIQTITILPLTLDNIVFPAAYVGVCGESVLPDHTGWPTVDGNPITEDNSLCNIFVGYWDKELNDCGGGRKIARTWTVLNWCTVEVAEAVQVIKLSDNAGPELTCPADYEVGTDFWYCYANVSVPKPIAEDECSEIASYSLTSSEGIVVSFGNNYVINGLPVGSHTVTWTVYDECGNSSTCSFNITVVDDVVPVANCDLHTIVSLTNDGPSGITLVPADVFDDGSYDNCGPVTFRARRMDSCIDIDWTTDGACIDDHPGGVPAVNSRDRGTVHRPCVPFACCDVGAGPIMVELEVTDAAGNVNYCMVEAEVQDKISPFVQCPSDIIVSCDFWFNVQEGTFVDGEGNNNGALDEDPLSAVFGNMYDAFRYDESIRKDIIINDPSNEDYSQPHNWGLEGWADDNCEVNLQVRVRIIDDCSGDDLPGNAPDGAVKLIERRFSASDGNEGVAPGTCTQRIWVVDYDPFYITDNTCNNSNPQDGVIWPCDVLLTTCPEDLGNTGEPTIFDDACSLIGVTYEDQRFDFVDGACFKILRTWAVIDWCQYRSDGEGGYYGLWHYTQVIKVHDQDGPEFVAPCETVTLCVADAGVSLPDNNQAFLGEDNPLASSCSVHLNLSRTVHETCSDVVNYDVKLYPYNGTDFIYLKTTTPVTVDENNDAVLSFDTRQNSIKAIRDNGLPYNSQFCGDYHRILWSVEDGCGNLKTCEYLIRLEDCKQPSPVCINGLSTVVMPVGGQVTVWAKDFNASSFDDCTPEADLLYSFSGDVYTPSYTYTCQNVPAFNTELSTAIWVADAGTDDNCNSKIEWSERNKDYCTTTIVITDNAGVCDTSGPIVGSILAGEVFTEDLQPVEKVSININAPGHVFPTYLTAQDGQYSFNNLVIPEHFTVQAARNDNHRNGVSTLDLVKIQKHLLGIETMDNPYDLIAADANNSQSVSAIDLIELRKLILGIYAELPANQSWRFVDKHYQFANADNPWPFREYIDMPGMSADEMDEDFVAIKVGDVNNSVQANANQVLPRNGKGVVTFVTDNREVSAGELVRLEISSADIAGIEGYQFTMDANGLEFRGIEAGSISMSDENIGVFGSRLTASWHKVGGVNATATDVLFTLHFQATASGKLSEMISLNSKVITAEAYNTASDIKDLKLTFRGAEGGAEFALYQNEPNPYKGTTVIGYDLPEGGDVTLTLFDVTGKVVYTRDQQSVKGYNTILLSSKDIPSKGVLYYRLDANGYSATKKMIIIE